MYCYNSKMSHFQGDSSYKIFQLADSLFPTGAFACSYGLETYAQEDRVHDAKTLSSFISTSVRVGLGHGDALFTSMSYISSQKKSWEEIIDLDNMIHTMKLAREPREASIKMGRRLAATISSVYPNQEILELSSMVETRKLHGHHPIVFGALFAHLDISREDCIKIFLYTWLSTIISAAIRLRIIGPIEGQQQIASQLSLLTEASNAILSRNLDDLAPSCLGLDIRMMQHENSYSRLFIT